MGGCDAQYGGQTLTYAELEQVWVQNNPQYAALAPLMAAIALAESGGNSGIVNTCDNNGAQSSWGLWQISLGNHNPPAPNWNDPNVNAQLAAQKLQSQGLYAWSGDPVFTSGQWKQYVGSNFPMGPISSASGPPGSLGATGPTSGGMPSLTGAANPTPYGPEGSNTPLTPGQTSTGKCVFSIAYPNSIGSVFTGNGGTFCLWYEGWSHGLVGIMAISAGGWTILFGLALLGLSTRTGRSAVKIAGGAALAGKTGGASGAASGAAAESPEQIFAAEQRRQQRQSVREYYRGILSPRPSLQQQAQTAEARRQWRHYYRLQHRWEQRGGKGRAPTPPTVPEPS